MIRAKRTLGATVLLLACAPAARSPWSASVPPLPAARADVKTLNPGYKRLESHVLVREVERPTRAALDYAAYHQNFMLAEPPPEDAAEASGPAQVDHAFGDLLEAQTLTADLGELHLSPEESSHPFAFAPYVEALARGKVSGAAELAEVRAKVQDESFGAPHRPGVASQHVSEVYLHAVAGKPAELYVKVEFEPWFTALGRLPDQDGDGYPELYGRVRADHVTPGAAGFLAGDYATKPLSASELKLWANELSSYWYPSFNTDLVPAGPKWPDTATEPNIVRELGGQSFEPTFVLRGKPQGEPTYDVFVVRGVGGATEATAATASALKLPKTTPSPDTKTLAGAVAAELAQQGGSWDSWLARVAPARRVMAARLKALPTAQKALAGQDGFLFFRRSLEFAVAGDLERQKPGKNPLPVIVEFKQLLAAHGVDFLFVPVPTKEEIFPDALDPKLRPFIGQVVQPYVRKLEQDLAKEGVEVLDLLSPLLAARTAPAKPNEEPLYQRQDTHWTARGLELAAKVISERVKRYPWYGALAAHAQKFTLKDAPFQRFGDLQSRLPEAQQAAYKPESLLAHQVVAADGSLYEDDPASPVVVLGDSYTGVYELTDAEHAGLSAHLARELGYPTDLVMSYGGGPNVRAKLLRRGKDALDTKKLVVWVMTARDLYDYWEAWEPAGSP